jgi:cytidylate kinase
MSVVTIRGQSGSGAPELGRQVAKGLAIDYVDREIIAEVAARLHLQEQDIITKEMPPGTIMGRIAEVLARAGGYGFGEGIGGTYLPTWQIPLDDDRYFRALESVVRELARSRSLVIMGRGSQFILKEHPGSLHVFVVAPLEVRVKRIMQDLNMDKEAAGQEVARIDGSHQEFIKRYFHAELEDPVHYDLVINTGRLSFEAAASTVINTFGPGS